MLTNNKKSRFVKGIALLLAALMVFAVCLTGCSDKDARADIEALKTEKTTAADVSALIADALKDYLKTADADAKVKALVEESMAGCVTTDDLAAYAKSDELKALSDKLASYVTKADVETLIKNALASYDINKGIDEAIKSGKILDAADVQAMIDKALEKYLTKAEIEERLKGYATAAELKAGLDKLNKAMGLDEWNEATTMVIETLTSAEDLLTRVEEHTFTQAAKKEINDLCGMTLFPYDATSKTYGAFDSKNADETLAALGLAILRAPNTDAIQDILDGFTAAADVDSLEDELTDVAYKLYALGNSVAVDMNGDGKFDDKDKAADKTTYHGTDISKAQQIAQVVTLNDKAAYNAIKAEIDALIVKYVMDPCGLTGTDYTSTDIYDVYKKADGSIKVYAVGSRKGSPYSTSSATDADKDYTYSYTTAGLLNVAGVPATAGYTKGAGSSIKDYGTIHTDATTVATGKIVKLLNQVTPVPAGKTEQTVMANTYAAIQAMIDDCQALVDAANNTFKAYLTKIKTPDAGKKETLDSFGDDVFVGGQVAYMCEPTTQPANTWTAPWLTTVTEAVEAAKKINGGSTVELYRYGLYEKLLDRAYDLLFQKYQTKALEVLNIMLNDYLVATEAAVVDGTTAGYVAANTAAATNLKLSADQYTANFLAAFYNGTDYTWDLGPTHKNAGIAKYYANTNAAVVPTLSGTTIGTATLDSDVLAYIAANAQTLKIELAASTVGVRAQIASASLAAKKGSGIAVQKAFDEELKAAKANLDEIVNRVTYAPVKNALINDVYASVADIDADKYVGGVAVYFNAGTKSEAIEDMLKKYVTGYNDTLAANGFSYAPIMNGSAVTGYTVNKNGNGATVDAMAAITVDPFATLDKTTVAMVGTEAIAKAEAVKAAAINTMANMAVKAQFNTYLREAKESLYFTYLSYAMKVSDYSLLNKLQQTYNAHLEQITIIEYTNNRGAIALEDYLDTYKQILNDVIACGSSYYALTAKGERAKALEDIKSYGKDVATYAKVVKPATVVTGEGVDDGKGGVYFATGSAAVDFDKIVNTGVTDKDGKNPLY
ncbi:MAG: hypothetical protein IJW97_02030 [Clostridia bacterium]|nr:hypothetical protein [Clostridia bacterium]